MRHKKRSDAEGDLSMNVNRGRHGGAVHGDDGCILTVREIVPDKRLMEDGGAEFTRPLKGLNIRSLGVIDQFMVRVVLINACTHPLRP
jgi:hypothetical protein